MIKLYLKRHCKMEELTKEELFIFESEAGSELNELGYSLTSDDNPKVEIDQVEFEKSNIQLMKIARQNATPSDIEHRKPQEKLLASIRGRLA